LTNGCYCRANFRNWSLRTKTHIVSQIIAQTIEEGKIKADEQQGSSRKFAQYLPYWV